MSSYFKKALSLIKEPGNKIKENFEVQIVMLAQNVSTILLELNRVFVAIKRMEKYVSQLKHLFSGIIQENEQLVIEIREKNELIRKYKESINKYGDDDVKKSAIEFTILEKENEILHTKIKALETTPEIIAENNDLKKEKSKILSLNEQLNEDLTTYKKDIESKKLEIADLNSKINRLKGDENSSKDDPTIKMLKRGLESSDNDKSSYDDLEEQLNYYKEEVKNIENRFLQYKNIFEEFNVQETQDNIVLLKENIQIKDMLISELYILIEKYRKLKDNVFSVFTSN